ncbi:Transmembrane emp24 domain-containing protein p24delta4 [Hibiscus syriacus]|uniref:Transmembrane emp24 domain-containing protein p24delta4 n=1 Tax=Hibiscus syriacus TaxID=106335 RepID=A0A6A2ZKP3_HIBSY|nr:Transmembrane emp24 domain-containing protein p24delta4 [Hibiscus syriacus]
MQGKADVRRSVMFRSAALVVLLCVLSNVPAGDAIWLTFLRPAPSVSPRKSRVTSSFWLTTSLFPRITVTSPPFCQVKDWESVARKEKIEGVELELRKLEAAVEAIHENLLYLRDREAELRTTSENTNARVAWFSIMSLGICIAAACLQIWYLKRYFQKKKLI